MSAGGCTPIPQGLCHELCFFVVVDSLACIALTKKFSMDWGVRVLRLVQIHRLHRFQCESSRVSVTSYGQV